MAGLISLSCIGASFGLALWGLDAARRWTEPIAFVVMLATVVAVWAVNEFEERDALRHPYALLLSAWAATLAPGLALAAVVWSREPTALAFAVLLATTLGRSFTVLGQIGWALLPALYAGAALCRVRHRQRPGTDTYFWGLMAAAMVFVWLRFAGRRPFGGTDFEADAVLVATLASAILGAGLGRLFARTGYPPAR